MNDPLQNFAGGSSLKDTVFSATSRYHGIETKTTSMKDGKAVVFLRRRFVPSAERFADIGEHTVVQEDRLDRLAAHYLGDSEQFWKLCDANGAMRPAELTETAGRKLRITLPEGIPAPDHA